MPEDENASTGNHTGETTEKPKVRRVSNKAPRKPGAKAPVKDTSPEATDADAPVAEAESGKPEQKRGNRRRRAKGKPSGQEPDQARRSDAPAAGDAETSGEDTDSGKKDGQPSPRDKPRNSKQPVQKPRRKLDSGKVAKHAWKIYLAEVSEEGVALIGDNDARELVRRCFRLSEIFLEEEDRRD